MDDSTRDSVPPSFDLGIAGFDGAVVIGRGGFSVVYRAREVDLDRDVAIKVLQVNPDDGEWRAFERERRALGALSQHPHVVTVFASGFTADGRPYLSMEYMAGGSLADRIAHGPLPWPEAVEITIRVAGALQAAHDIGVLHRDIKPGNILVSGYGEPKLADFGIARIEGRPETRSGVVSATIEHAAPEVLAGQRPTAAADVYSLGSTLYALVSGRAPFTRDADESIAPLLARIATSPVPDLSGRGIPAPVCRVLEAALAKYPAERIQTAEDLAQRLHAAAITGDDDGAPAAVPGPPIPHGEDDRPRGRRRVVVGVVVAIVLAASAATVLTTRSHGTSSGVSAPTPRGYVPRFVSKACGAQLLAADPRVTCGELVVPENRAKPSGRKLRLAVTRAPATRGVPDPTPTISFALDAPSVDSSLSSTVRQLGEHITLAGRGGPDSTPGLKCPNVTTALLDALTLPTRSPDARSQLESAFRACRDTWADQGVDLASYGSTDDALDVRDLAWTLKLTKINIEARAADTTVALKVAASAPELVRAIVLEDVTPPGSFFGSNIDNPRRAFAHYAAACAAQPACKAAHPDLQARLAQTYAALSANPVVVSVPDPTDTAKQPIPVLLDGDRLLYNAVSAVGNVLAMPRVAAALDPPDFSAAAEYATIGPTFPQVVIYLVRTCLDEFPNINRLQLQGDAHADPMYSTFQELTRLEACTVIDAELPTEPPVAPNPGGVPTLILVGELNPLSSQQWANDTAHSFGNVFVIMLPNLTIDPIGNGPPCVAQLRLDFLRHPQQRPHAHACIVSIPPIQFFGT